MNVFKQFLACINRLYTITHRTRSLKASILSRTEFSCHRGATCCSMMVWGIVPVTEHAAWCCLDTLEVTGFRV